MAFGIKPKHIREISLDTLNKEEFLTLALTTAQQCGWEIGIASPEGFKAYSKISMSSWSEEITLHIVGEVATLKSECTSGQLFDFGRNKKNTESFVLTFNSLKASYDLEQLHAQFSEWQTKFTSTEEIALNGYEKTGIAGILSIFKPVEGYFITPLLININIILFIMMCVSGANVFLPDNNSLLNWGGNYKPVTLDGQWWRLLTSAFLHIGIIHLLFNLYALMYIGILLEPLLGKWKFLIAYLLTALTASVASLWWHDNTISAGASGAIFGMYGVFLALLTTNFIDKAERNSMLSSILVFVGYNLLFGMKSGIDNAAHIGGLVGGLFLGYAIYFTLIHPDAKILRNAILIGSSLVVLCFTSVMYMNVSNPMGDYIIKMEEFSKKETAALAYYNLPENTPTGIIEKTLTEGITLWKENEILLNEIGTLNLSVDIKLRNNLLKDYCAVRLRIYTLVLRAISNPDKNFDSEMEQNNIDLNKVIKQLESLN